MRKVVGDIVDDNGFLIADERVIVLALPKKTFINGMFLHGDYSFVELLFYCIVILGL